MTQNFEHYLDRVPGTVPPHRCCRKTQSVLLQLVQLRAQALWYRDVDAARRSLQSCRRHPGKTPACPKPSVCGPSRALQICRTHGHATADGRMDHIRQFKPNRRAAANQNRHSTSKPCVLLSLTGSEVAREFSSSKYSGTRVIAWFSNSYCAGITASMAVAD
ncbi:MAG: hypothetical protein ACI9BW_004655 [Gammaproteobacteria bacterium]|jgi:hypothetical protein